MKMFVIKFQSGEYLTKCRITSNYLRYERTIHEAAADRLNDFDSQLVIKRLVKLGQKRTFSGRSLRGVKRLRGTF
jgi:hypothetical protein